MNLIHDEAAFAKDTILKRSEQYGFSGTIAVEMFLWDIELAAQLQRIDARLILKGGAAAQLFLPLEKQRGSVDIDMTVTASVTVAEVADSVGKVEKAIPSLHFKPYAPAAPNLKLPLVTYFVDVPSAFQPRGRKNLEIKADILLENAGLPTVEIRNAETFALQVRRISTPTLGSCIGDKLLTLAKASIGMTKEEDYPKQMYDVDLLSLGISAPVFADIADAVAKLTPIEASYRGLKTRATEAIRDVQSLTSSYATIDTSIALDDNKKSIRDFQQFLVNQDQRLAMYGWASRALRIRFLARLVDMMLSQAIDTSEAAKRLNRADDLVKSLDLIPSSDIQQVRKDIIGTFLTKVRYFKELKAKPLSRVFWEAATPDNLDEVASLLNS
jgi:hypothetical protein